MINDTIHTLSIWIVVLPFVMGLLNYRRLNNDSKWLFALVIVALIPQLLTAVLTKENGLLNFSYNLYTPVEFGLLLPVFFPKYKGVANRFVVKATSIAYTLAVTYLFIRFGLVQRFLNELVCINNVIYMVWILLLLLQEFESENTVIQKENPFTWYLIALIIYAPCTVIVFALYYYIRDPGSPALMNLWTIQSIANILLYLLFSIGLFIRKTY